MERLTYDGLGLCVYMCVNVYECQSGGKGNMGGNRRVLKNSLAGGSLSFCAS